MLPAEVRAQFAESVSGYLDTPTMGIAPRVTYDRVRAALDEWHRAAADFERWGQDAQACRGEFAGLIDVPAGDVALLPSVVPAAAAAASTLATRRGLIVAHRAEFRSLLLPFLARLGDERVRWVDGPYTADTFLAALDGDVGAVVLSSVASADGARPDLGRIVDACATVGAAVIVDATQSLGIVGLSVPATRLAGVLAAGYKGLLAPRGTAYGYLRPDLVDPTVSPSPSGMADADQAGSYGPPWLPKPGAPGLDQSPAWLSWLGALPALRLLREIPAAARAEHALALASQLRAGLAQLGVPTQATDLPSPVVSIAARQPEAVVDALRRGGIRSAARRGRVRFGFHLYNLAADVEAVLDVLTSASVRPLC